MEAKAQVYLDTVFEQYEFKNWVITICNWHGTEKLIGFATPCKFSHILDPYNYIEHKEILEENGFYVYDSYGHEIECPFLVAEPDDAIVYFCANVDVTNANCVLDFMVNQIIEVLDIRRPKTIVLKQTSKKAQIQKSTKKQRGFMQVAWSSLVKERDGKCTNCGSVYDLHAHHIKPFKDHPELRYNVNNGITLCGSCHRTYHRNNGR